MAKDMAMTRRVIVEGLVQGVGYRAFTRRAALRLRISGWARTRADGTVEAVLVGAPADIEALLSEMRRGPRGAQVSAVRIVLGVAYDDPPAAGFVIRPSA